MLKMLSDLLLGFDNKVTQMSQLGHSASARQTQIAFGLVMAWQWLSSTLAGLSNRLKN